MSFGPPFDKGKDPRGRLIRVFADATRPNHPRQRER
jgi:hypothetical protein